MQWKEGAFEKLKARAIGTYQFFEAGQFGSQGPGPEDIGYVVAEDIEKGSFTDHDKFYTMFFEAFPGRYFIGFDYTGKFTPYQETLFTTKE